MGSVADFWAGPRPHDNAARRALAGRLADEYASRFGSAFLTAGLYGSVARGTDLPYSDVEMYVLIEGEHEENYEEWVWGDGRVEVNVIGWESALQMADEVEEDWPLARGQFVYAECVAGDADRVAELRQRSLAAPQERFDHAMREILLNEHYENLGKLRNAQRKRVNDAVPALACEFALWTAMLIGLAHRHCYRGSAGLLREALGLPDPPEGFDLLVRLVCEGRLSDLDQTARAIEDCWRGIGQWVSRRGLPVERCLRPPHA